MDRRYISETAPIFWSNLHRLKLNKGRVTINNIVDQIKRDFGIDVSRNEVLEVLFADEIKQNSRKGTLQTSPIVKPPSKRPKSAPYRKNPRTSVCQKCIEGCRFTVLQHSVWYPWSALLFE